MNKFQLFAATVMIVLVFSSCEKCELDCDLVPAKIIRYDCDRVIFQILDSKVVGDPVWKDVQTGREYSNVISYYNTCKIATLAKGEKVILYVNIKQPDNFCLPDCMQCEALSQHPPQTKVDFTTIADRPCEDKMSGLSHHLNK